MRARRYTRHPPKPAFNHKDELEEALDNVRLSGQSERKSEERPASTERLGFDARALDMVYLPGHEWRSEGPRRLRGTKADAPEIDELSASIRIGKTSGSTSPRLL